ncbi:MAG: hypothetical protein DSZ02_09915 [Gammaproteobacteria bacterium]|nr:MAG: hypothetical protein DSZ02_09915 [Gammaproteobacteria bacterium]
MVMGLAKKILVTLVLLVMVAPLMAAQKGLLYEVSRPGEATHYLFGTMHSDDSRVLAVLEGLKQPLASVDQVVLEILPDAMAMVEVSVAMLLPPEQSLSKLIGKELFERAAKVAAEKGLPRIAVERMRPWALAITLGTPELTGEAMDQAIYRRALSAGKQLLALETPAEQMALFDSLPDDLQVRLLKEVLEQRKHLAEQLEALTQAYLDRDLEKLQELSLDYEVAGDELLAEWFRKKLILDRNRTMYRRLLPILDRGATLVAVGALHLAGKEGLVTLLRRAGYRVEPLF